MRSVMHSRSRALAISINVRILLLRRVAEQHQPVAALRSVAFENVGCIRVRRTILTSLVTRIFNVALPLRVRTLYVVMHSVALQGSFAARITCRRVDIRQSLVADRYLRVQTQYVAMRSVMLRRRSRALAITTQIRHIRLRRVERQRVRAAMRRAASGSAACTRVRRTILSSLVTRQLDVALPLRVRTQSVVMHSVALSRAARITCSRVDTRESRVADRRLPVQTQSVVMRSVMHSRSFVQRTTSTSRRLQPLLAVQTLERVLQLFVVISFAERMFARRCMYIRIFTR
jgi:hypothetical protein